MNYQAGVSWGVGGRWDDGGWGKGKRREAGVEEGGMLRGRGREGESGVKVGGT